MLVAIVDDERNVLESIADLLLSAGYATVTFQSASALLHWNQLRRIDCVVSDIRMPGMDGWQLASELRRVHERLPIVLMTAHDPQGGMVDASLAALALPEILRKPFEPQLLLDAIARALLRNQ